MQQRDASSTLVCPFLGLCDDPSSYAGFPSPLNCCFHPDALQPVVLEHQGQHCLADYGRCPVYRQPEGVPFPKTLILRGAKEKTSSRRWALGLLGALLILLAVLGLQRTGWMEMMFYPREPELWSSPPGAVTVTGALGFQPTESPMPWLTPIPTLTRTLTAAPTVTPAWMPPPTFTATPTPQVAHQLEELLGPHLNLLLHQVQEGESLGGLANRYQTSIEAIKKVNYRPISPAGVEALWAGTVLVIPVGVEDVSGWPLLEPYQVKEPMLPLQLAQALGVPLPLLLAYNWLRADEVLQSGWWLIVPHSIEANSEVTR